ncbi:MAG: hypothetical protein KKE84_13015 [Gammaproteobacteria bacterium]|nr:hypothetical protein [Gammaproteobacteria bacterium]
MSVIPCQQNAELQIKIREFAEVLKTQSHRLGEHGLDEQEFYNSGVFRGAIERVRGQFAASMRDKREFVQHVLNHMQDGKFIKEWNSAGSENRHDYTVTMPSGRTAVIELKGCLDGNNTNIFERPPHAQEFIIWSVCTNPGADPQHNVWSGIHTRLSAEIISQEQRVDGILIWDMVCGTFGRPCPKLTDENDPRLTELSHYRLPPPCIYLLPATIPSPRNNPSPPPQQLQDVELLQAFANCFHADANDLNYVSFAVSHDGAETVRSTTITRNGVVQRQSGQTAIRRS